MFEVVRSPWMIPARWRRPTIWPIPRATFIAAGPPLSSTRRDARRPRKTFHRLALRVADDQTEKGDAPHPPRYPGRSIGVAALARRPLAGREPGGTPRRDGRISAAERSRGLRGRTPEWRPRGVRGGDDPPPC